MARLKQPTRKNVSGYVGVSWHNTARKWEAKITKDLVHYYLGLYPTPIAAHEAYVAKAAELFGAETDFDLTHIREELLKMVRQLYDQHGPIALSTPFLEKQRNALYPRLLKAGLKQDALLKALGLAEEYQRWRNTNRTYRGQTKPKWTWETAIARAREIVATEGDLPTLEEARRCGLHGMIGAIHRSDHTWGDLRQATGCPLARGFRQSRNGMRWRSRSEARLSNFLYARGIEHKRGERYPDAYSKATGKHWAQYDLHFRVARGRWINVEVWGEGLNTLSKGRYRKTRKAKEMWHEGRSDFLGIPYLDCLSDDKLAGYLKPYIGSIEPHVFDSPSDHIIETCHWSDSDELLQTCRKIAASTANGIFPTEEWLRKRRRHKNRKGPAHNTLAVYVNQWLGGTRNVRKLLGQEFASTTAWTRDSVITAWRALEKQHGVTPSQCKGKNAKRLGLSYDIIAEGCKIYEAARRLDAVAAARNGRTARRIKWTPEYTLEQWRGFVRIHNCSPIRAMHDKGAPRKISSLAIRIYDAARRIGVLEKVRLEERILSADLQQSKKAILRENHSL